MPVAAIQYRVVQAIPLVSIGTAFIGSLFISDTPRWRMSSDREDEALSVLRRLLGTFLPPSPSSPDRDRKTLEFA